MNHFNLTRWSAGLCLVVATLLSGCLWDGTTNRPRPTNPTENTRVAPAPSQFGAAPARIVSHNSDLGFVVIDFSSRVMPIVGTRLNVYRAGKRVGSVRLTEPIRARLATADIVEGELRIGDEAR